MKTTLAAWWKSGNGMFRVEMVAPFNGVDRLRKVRFADGKDHILHERTWKDGSMKELWSSGPITYARDYFDKTSREVEGEVEA